MVQVPDPLQALNRKHVKVLLLLLSVEQHLEADLFVAGVKTKDWLPGDDRSST